MAGQVGCPHRSGTDVYTLCEGFQQTVLLDPDAVAIRTVGDGQRITWREYAERVRAIAAGLAAIGVGRGDTVGLMLTNRPEYELVDTAALHLGAIPFSIYNTSSPEQINYLFGNAGNRVVVTERQFLDRIAAGTVPGQQPGQQSGQPSGSAAGPAGDAASGPAVERVVCVDGPAEGAMTLDELVAGGSEDFDFGSAWRATKPDDVVTLIYTSGTTGPPKGVEITNANVMAQLRALLDHIESRADDRIVSYLPAAHIADRVASHYSGLVRGAQITCVDDPRKVAAALTDARPTVFFGVPRVWQKIKAGIEARLATEPKQAKRRIATWAIDVGQRTAERRLAGRRVPPVLAAQHVLADRLVLAKLRHAIGMDQLHWAASGAAAIPPETLAFFHGIGVGVYEVWGMSETTGVGTMNAPGQVRLGSVGKAIAGVELRLGTDGELLIRGPINMRGYRREPEKTADTVDGDGWLHTGDIATIDDDGFVTIVDRKKELILSEGGKVESETRGWREETQETASQRSKEEAHDYRYFPEPDLPPLVLAIDWIDKVKHDLPELPAARRTRYAADYGLGEYDVDVLWFDGEWVDWWTREDARDLEAFMRGLKPDIIINNRIFNSREGSMAGISPAGMPGDFHTPEQEAAAGGGQGLRARVDSLRAEVQRVADELDLPPEFLARRRLVEKLVRNVRSGRDEPLPEELRGWRREVIGERLLAAARG